MNITKVVKKILKILSYIFLLLLVLYAVLSFIEPKKAINTFGYQYYVIISNSMEPDINVGDMVIVKKIDFEKLEPNDIITFYADIDADGKKEVVTHYFDSIETNQGELIYRTRRANTTNLDSWRLNADDIIGEHVYQIPKVGKFIMFLKSPIGIFIILVDFIFILLLIKVTNMKIEKEVEYINLDKLK